MHKLAHIFRLGIKELTSLRHDSVLLLFLFYAFTVAIYMPAAGSVIGVHNASVAFVDEDHSALSRQMAEALQPPEFQPPAPLAYDQLDKVMDSGQYTFVINVPANFQADLLAGRQPGVQVNVDATAMSQAFMGAGYIGRIFQRELLSYSGQTDATRQAPALLTTRALFNMGGGFPANYITRTNSLETYAEEIIRFLKEDFGDELPEIILEPGRSLIANAGILVSEVVLVARKSRTAVERWVYTDVGKFSGLIETMDEAIKFPIWTEKKGEMEEVVIAGPTCDSADIMYENYKYGLPLNLAIGDRLYWLSTGAYTTSYSAVEFNGFPPLKSFYL